MWLIYLTVCLDQIFEFNLRNSPDQVDCNVQLYIDRERGHTGYTKFLMVTSSDWSMASAVRRSFWRSRWIAPAKPKTQYICIYPYSKPNTNYQPKVFVTTYLDKWHKLCHPQYIYQSKQKKITFNLKIYIPI